MEEERDKAKGISSLGPASCGHQMWGPESDISPRALSTATAALWPAWNRIQCGPCTWESGSNELTLVLQQTEEVGTGEQTPCGGCKHLSLTQNAEHMWLGRQPSGEPGSGAGSLWVSLGPVKLFVLIKVEGWGLWTVQVGRLLL